MALVIPAGFGQVGIEMRHSADPDPWYVTFGVDLADVGGNYDDACDSISDAWFTSFGQELSSNVTTTAVTINVGQDGADNLIFRKGYNLPGTSDVAKLPQNCALLISKNSNLGGRKHRGRMFIPGILSETNVSETGVLAPGYDATYTAIAQAFLGDLTTGSGAAGAPATPMVILHNASGATPLPTFVSSLSASPVISTQRRRLR